MTTRFCTCVALILWSLPLVAFAEEHPLSPDERQNLESAWRKQMERLTKWVEEDPKQVQAYSQRGDARMFLGEFPEAVTDYRRMVELDEKLDASHWRLGIALFFAERYDEAAAQFDRYHAFDDVDRENGIWRYLSQYRASGKEEARKELLRYEKDDREPFPDVYRLFSGEITPKEIHQRIEADELSETERDKRLFYAHLYIGMNELVEERPDSAREHLHQAVQNRWPRRAGYGPRYMWQVARLQYDLLVDER
jgi:lipoprotein NlpI